MSNQVQCPNCGGYRVREVENVLGSGKWKKAERTRAFIAWMAMAVPVIVIGALIVNSSPEELVPSITCGAILLAVPTFLVLNKTATRIIGKVHRCDLCGYIWRQLFDEPSPPVTIRPDLIAKGEQRLKEEEHQRYLQEAWWDEQQRKKGR